MHHGEPADRQNYKRREDEWVYTLDGLPGFAAHRSETDAILAAEKELFQQHGKIAQKQLDKALEENDIKLALALAERRGYWLGITDQRRQVSAIVNGALSLLTSLVRT